MTLCSQNLLFRSELIKTDIGDPVRHYTVDLFDKHLIPIGSIRVYLNGECRLLRDASDEAMLVRSLLPRGEGRG